MNDIDTLKKMINESNNIVVFTGAGVSTESGLKDFRSSDGIYNLELEYDRTPEYMLSSKCFYNETNILQYLSSLQILSILCMEFVTILLFDFYCKTF